MTDTSNVPQFHPTALIDPQAHLGEGVKVGPFAVIEEQTEIGERTELRAHVVIKRFTVLGRENLVCEGAILGGEPQDFAFAGARSGLTIGDRNRIRECVTIHRGSQPGSMTAVGSGCFLMAGAHVAHDCRLGDQIVMANGAALAGFVTVGDRAFLSGGVGVHQFCNIGRLAMIGGHTKVVQDCLPFVITDGAPARARGLNLVGLKRAGFTPEQMRALRRAYRTLLRSALPLEEALQRLETMQDPLADEMVTFVRASKRGFTRARGAVTAVE